MFHNSPGVDISTQNRNINERHLKEKKPGQSGRFSETETGDSAYPQVGAKPLIAIAPTYFFRIVFILRD